MFGLKNMLLALIISLFIVGCEKNNADDNKGYFKKDYKISNSYVEQFVNNFFPESITLCFEINGKAVPVNNASPSQFGKFQKILMKELNFEIKKGETLGSVIAKLEKQLKIKIKLKGDSLILVR